jgi:hypothetical protein
VLLSLCPYNTAGEKSYHEIAPMGKSQQKFLEFCNKVIPSAAERHIPFKKIAPGMVEMKCQIMRH